MLTIFTRVLRGFLLIIWILILSSVAFTSLTGGLANYVFPAVQQESSFRVYRYAEKEHCSGAGTLADYLQYRDDPPPIGVVLDVVLPDWGNAIECDPTVYQSLFQKVEGRLRSIARQSTDVKSVNVDATVLTFEFAQAMRKKGDSIAAASQQLPLELKRTANRLGHTPWSYAADVVLPPVFQGGSSVPAKDR